jgi:2,4-dienoyl-CoA reductase-like NADH-dependent reductase (Old Yellow Enzyme family)
MPALEEPIEIRNLELRNRLYRAPLLEHAGNGDDAVDILRNELEPSAAGGVGLIMQGAMPVRGGGEGCAAPRMTFADDGDFVRSLAPVPEAVHDHGGRIFAQFGHGGIKSLETWHADYKERWSDLEQQAVSELPWLWKIFDTLGLMEFDLNVMSTEEVYELAEDMAESARYAVEAGYDGIHLAGATMGIFQQFASPFYNDRDDEFGGSLSERAYFFKVVHDEIRAAVGDHPITTKVPAETDSPWYVRDHITLEEGVELCRMVEEFGYDAVTPVTESPFWDQSIIKGNFPDRAWEDDQFADGYAEAFGGEWRYKIVKTAAQLNAKNNDFNPGWNEDFCRRVRARVDIPVMQVGGIRDRPQIDRLLNSGACDMVGMGRPFYAEPKLAARLLEDEDAAVICENCNNCIPPQVAGESGICRTPHVLEKRGELEKAGAYDRETTADATVDTAADADTTTVSQD